MCGQHYQKLLKIGTPKITTVTMATVVEVEQFSFFIAVLHPDDAEGRANSVDPDQTRASDKRRYLR